MNGLKYDVIIGADFLNKHNVIIDYDSNEVKLGDNFLQFKNSIKTEVECDRENELIINGLNKGLCKNLNEDENADENEEGMKGMNNKGIIDKNNYIYNDDYDVSGNDNGDIYIKKNDKISVIGYFYLICNFQVADRDTLTSVAARFDTTPSELTKLNRLATPFIFPGQQLYVPLRELSEHDSDGSTPIEDTHDDLPPEEKELLDNLRPVSPKPGHAERIRTPSGPQGSSEMEEESAVYKRFLKINVKHITDGQGVVSGVLLVTPNAVMFDPNVSDPLVIEHGPEAYGVIAPMEFVVNAAIYSDIAHMRVGHIDNSSTEKPEIYYPKCERQDQNDSLLVKDETFPELVTADDAESVCSCTEREGDAFPKAFERDLVTPTNLDEIEQQQQRSAEERRKSLLDHHWAIPSRDRQSMDTDDVPVLQSALLPEEIEDEDSNGKPSCHDSGIDIRDTSIPPAAPVSVPAAAPVVIPAKKIYSDADIVLSKDWVPPITIAPTHITGDTESPVRKKTPSVSFSLDSTSEADPNVSIATTTTTESRDEMDKGETRKNKMLKRLSYPLSWMETFGGEKEDEKSTQPQPHSADAQHSSVFSKVFSSSPINLVDFGTGLFLNKTPSEDSGGSGGPHSGGSGGPPMTPATGMSEPESTSFFPTNIISSVGAMGASVGASVGAMGASVGASVGATVGAVGEAVGASVNAMGDAVNAVGATVGVVGRSSVGTIMKQSTETSKPAKVIPPKLDYRSMVSVDDMPELFVSFDSKFLRVHSSC
ncbi:nucleolar protein 7/estrogen receptor coactivator-related [Holotrichia oblita]|uniref:Nucleolar protein 7/estrogen receptor coactivator-related n=1 Tax=Holotrichia oblita TaxID=644536 RepID=A0ACB9TG80_HOLOL|nr:nucleolar protein 7/estrogen receptor coactivator-related [Holotrichia oblita]